MYMIYVYVYTVYVLNSILMVEGEIKKQPTGEDAALTKPLQVRSSISLENLIVFLFPTVI